MKRNTYKITVLKQGEKILTLNKYAWNSARRAVPDMIKSFLKEENHEVAELISENLTKNGKEHVYGVQTWSVLPCKSPEPFKDKFHFDVKIEKDKK